MIKGIIFDLDGTLADTILDLQSAMNRMLSFIGYSERTITEIKAALNNGATEFVRRSLPKEVQHVDFILRSALKEYEKQYSMCYLEKTVAYNNIEAMLMNLKQKGIKLAVLSNKHDKFVKDIVAELFDKKTFIAVQGHDKLPLKPNPSATNAIVKKMGIKPGQCLFVGDSDVDIQTANAAGMRSVGVSWGYRGHEALENAGATFVVKEANEICEIVDHLKTENAKIKRSKAKDVVIHTTQNCEYYNRKLLGTTEHSVIKLGVTGETSNTKTLSGSGEHNTKKQKKN